MLMLVNMCVMVDGGARGKKERVCASGKAHTLAILSLGSLTAAIIAVGELAAFSKSTLLGQ